MGLTSSELQQLAEDILSDRYISTNLHCSGCGYSLRTLRYVGRCPECGSEYNARKLWKEGVFSAGMLEFPIGNWLGTVLTVGGGGLFLLGWFTLAIDWLLMFAVLSFLLGVFYVRATWKTTARYLHFLDIVRRIEETE
jgi:hypothetical protein